MGPLAMVYRICLRVLVALQDYTVIAGMEAGLTTSKMTCHRYREGRNKFPTYTWVIRWLTSVEGREDIVIPLDAGNGDSRLAANMESQHFRLVSVMVSPKFHFLFMSTDLQ